MRAFLAAGGRLLVTLDPMRKQGETNAGVISFSTPSFIQFGIVAHRVVVPQTLEGWWSSLSVKPL